jgi:uncharacterized membrane protein
MWVYNGCVLADKSNKSQVNIGGVEVDNTPINRELFVYETTTLAIPLLNTANNLLDVQLEVDGDVKQFISFRKSSFKLAPNEIMDVLAVVVIPKVIDPQDYLGNIIIKSGSNEGKIPMVIKILLHEGKLMDLKISSVTDSVEPGETLRLQADLFNLGETDKINVQFDMQLFDMETGLIIVKTEEELVVQTNLSTIEELEIPENVKPGKYLVKGTAYYYNLEQNMQASSITYVNVQPSFLNKKFIGLPYWVYIISLCLLSLVLMFKYSPIQNREYSEKTLVDNTHFKKHYS